MIASAAPADVRTGSPYASNGEHLRDELRWLDHLLHLRLLDRRRDAGDDPLESFRGLVLSEQEIVRLLAGGPRRAPDPHDEQSDRALGATAAALDELALHIARKREASVRAGADLLLPRLSRIFHLGPFEERCLLICLAPEIDRKYEKLYAYLQDDVTRRKPTVGLLLELLCATRDEALAARAVFEPQACLDERRRCSRVR